MLSLYESYSEKPGPIRFSFCIELEPIMEVGNGELIFIFHYKLKIKNF